VTFTQLKTKVKDYCNLTSTEADTRIGLALNATYRRITASLGLDAARFVTRSQSMTDGVQTVTFTDIEKIDRIRDTTDSTALRALTEVSIDQIKSTQPSEGQPCTWALQNTDADSVTVVFDAIPQTAYSLQADGWTTLSDLSGTDEPAFPESYHDVLAWSVIAEELLKKEKDKLAGTYQAKADKLLADLRFFLADSPSRDTRQGSAASQFATASGGSGGGSGNLGGTAYTQSALVTFDRDPAAPFAVTSGSAVVPNLDADKLDGLDSTYFQSAILLDPTDVAYGAVGDGVTDDTDAFQACITACRTNNTGMIIPPLVYKISEELDVGGVPVIGATAGYGVDSFPGPMWPTFKPTSGFARLFRVGPRSAQDVTDGFTDRAPVKRIKIDLASADANFVAIGSTYGVAFKAFEDIYIRGVSGAANVNSKNFTGIRLFDANIATNIAGYNTLRRIHIFHCFHAFDLGSDLAGNNRNDDCLLEQCFAYNAKKYFTLFGDMNQMIDCGAASFDVDFDPSGGTHWVVKMWGNGTLSNKIDGFYVEGITNVARPFFYLSENVVCLNLRGLHDYAPPTSAPDYIQMIDDSGNPLGPQTTHGPVVMDANTLRASYLNVPHVHQNLIPNGNFESWIYGSTFSDSATGTSIAAGFTAVRAGTSTYTIDKNVTAGVTLLTHAQNLKLTCTTNSGVQGIRIDLASFYPLAGLFTLNKICVGMLVFVTNAQATADGAYVKVDDGVATSSETSVLKYDGTESYKSLQTAAGSWHVVLVNHELQNNMTKLELTFGLNNDGSHAGTGTIYIGSVFCYPGWFDWYTAWPKIQPTPLSAWNALSVPLYAVLGPVTAAWTPGLIASGAAATLSVTLPGAKPGDLCIVSYDQNVPTGCTLTANPIDDGSGTNKVRVVIANNSGAGATPTAGNVRVVVLKVTTP
jgi:hypothetical protein